MSKMGLHDPFGYLKHKLWPKEGSGVATLLWAKCGGEAQHSQSWELGVLRDSRMFRARQQGPKHLALRRSWCHWKVLET
jgi:hypothetical protein